MKWHAPVSIRQIAVGFITSLLVMMVLIAAFAVYQTQSVTRDLEQSNRAAARAEVAAAVGRLLRRMETQAELLAHWDETRQQLVQPEYYAYWRDQRVYESGLLQNRYTRTALYSSGGHILAPSPARHTFPARLPEGVSLRDMSGWLANESGTLVLYQSYPVYRAGVQQSLLGMGLLRLDFMPELLRSEDFRFADKDSIGLSMPTDVRLPTAQLLQQLRYKAQANPDQARFQTILARTLLAVFILLMSAALLGFVIYNRLLIRPMGWLSQEIDAMQQGHSRQHLMRARPMRITELENIRRSLYNYQLQLRDLHGSLEHQNREFHSQARQDALTGSHNRRAYEEDWAHFRTEIKSAPQGAAYLLFDCDRFKAINDTYGHAKGDRVLTIIANALTMALRANDRLYRLGGDEFATFLSNTTPVQAKQIAQRCQSLIEAAHFDDLEIREPIGVSIGVAFCPAENVDEVDELPKQADIAMYTAKQPGRTRIALFGEDTERASQTLVASRETSALFQALATPGMIEMHYQPIYDLPERTIGYYETLARIRHHDQLIMPGAFLPVVSARRLETEFDMAVLLQIDADLATLQFPAGMGISINISAQSISRPEIISQLMELSRHSARHPLMLEITETSLITQMSEVSTYLDLLRTVNFRIAMDDFGTGYSPLRYLVDLPVDVVKFDISLVNKLAEDNRAGQVVADFARMMNDVGYVLVAEGVESEEVLRKVESLGIAHAQGFLLGRPAPLAALAAAAAAAPAETALT